MPEKVGDRDINSVKTTGASKTGASKSLTAPLKSRLRLKLFGET